MVFSALIKFHVHDVLDLVAMGLGRESNFNDEPCRRIKLVQQDVLNIRSFTGSCWTYKKRSNIVRDEKFLHITISNGVNSGHNQLLGDSISRELINVLPVCKLHPVFPLLRLWNIAVIVDGTSVESSWQNLILELRYSLDLTVA
jgi:hypothetical protein